MKRKGFTLIELLAVIVILAVIALIATPAVLNIIEDSKRSSAEDSARIIAKEAETYYVSETTLQGNEVGDIDLTADTLKYKGEKPSKGYVTYDEKGNAYLKMYMNGYCVESNYDNTVESKKTEANDCKLGSLIIPLNLNGGTLDVTTVTAKEGSPLGALPTPTREDYIFAGWYTDGDVLVDENTIARENLVLTARWVKDSLTVTLDDGRLYTDGEIVYFNPITNSVCSNYTTSNSGYGFRGTADNGCLKWHTFLDSNDNSKIRLILDHNTSTSGMTLADAKTEIANVKDNNLYNWHADVRSTVRMISAEEINEISPYREEGTWTSAGNSGYYLYSGTQTINAYEKGMNKYAWLMDNLSYCERYGCNVEQYGQYGYWTSDVYDSSSESWVVTYYGQLYKISQTSTSYGVRPVIEVSKDLLSQEKEVVYGETYGKLPTITRTGYTFTGWYTTGGVDALEDSIVEIIEDTTLYAQWRANTYTVTFKKDNEVVSAKTVTYDQPYGALPPEQVKDEYLFKGWKKNNYTAITSETLVTTASNHDIEAIFVEKTYLEELYFNPVTNSACTESQYNATTNSVAGFKGTATNGCMKWYAYKEDGDNYLMILDHNTLEYWNQWGEVQTEIANVKDNNLYGWHEEVYPTARLISAEEVSEITSSQNWDLNGDGYHLHTGTSTGYNGIIGTNKYAWLFDNTDGCYVSACNVEQAWASGYWTSSVRDDELIWIVEPNGRFIYTNDQNAKSIRPVISVPKSKFTN